LIDERLDDVGSSLTNGSVVESVVAPGSYDFYSVFTDASQITQIQVVPDRGLAFLYASYANPMPNREEFEYAATQEGPNDLYFAPGSIGYTRGQLYFSVYGKTVCNYKLRVTITDT
jgi:hypothetical protein